MRDDHVLRLDLLAELASDPALASTKLQGVVKEGIATVTGMVYSWPARRAVERAAERVRGLRGIVVRVEVHLPPLLRRDDEEIRMAADYALRWNSVVPDGKVHVEVEDGWVTLSGEVDYDYQRASAERSVRQLSGICALDNKITLKPRADAGDIGVGISQALARHASREAHHIAVEVDGSVVTLRGEVGSLAERHAAIGTAYSAKGVSRVVDHLVVSG